MNLAESGAPALRFSVPPVRMWAMRASKRARFTTGRPSSMKYGNRTPSNLKAVRLVRAARPESDTRVMAMNQWHSGKPPRRLVLEWCF